MSAPETLSQAIQLSDLYPIDGLVAAHPALLSTAALRWQLRHRDTNGLAPACVRIGKKLLISKSRYETWLATRAGWPLALPVGKALRGVPA